ncbi:L,D-transpeptidase family protein [Jiella mangrovi]|uniref:L,D-transpeptidase family protein n=1 Tax=Jiella mangrovi TaxID=2821407 RepID=UPI001FD79265|nr:L,D-transpeptidase [Jiella mangrovi]
MKIKSLAAAGLLAATMPHVSLAGEWRPLSQEAIEAATFQSWQASVREANAVAATARRDDTVPDVHAADESPLDTLDQTRTGSTDAPPSAAAAMLTSEDVPVSDAPDLEITSPSYSTDLPDEASLETADEQKHPDPFLIRLQILLDRAHASPGVIDGFNGENTRKAIAAYEAMRGLPEDGEIDADLWVILTVDQGKAIKTYTITEEDAATRYVDRIPDDYGELAKMEWLGYQSPAEMFGERFHMDEDLLLAMNPNADLRAAGTRILVADVGQAPTTKVARIVIDKERGELIAYDANGNIVLLDPATIGSDDTPSPSGHLTVTGVAENPTYSYNPARNFTQGDNTGPLTIPAGPNGPVGSTWIALSKPTFGIHGTPYPSRIDKSRSHGCVRLTNWDAAALAKLVQPSVTTVEFVDKSSDRLAVK